MLKKYQFDTSFDIAVIVTLLTNYQFDTWFDIAVIVTLLKNYQVDKSFDIVVIVTLLKNYQFDTSFDIVVIVTLLTLFIASSLPENQKCGKTIPAKQKTNHSKYLTHEFFLKRKTVTMDQSDVAM